MSEARRALPRTGSIPSQRTDRAADSAARTRASLGTAPRARTDRASTRDSRERIRALVAREQQTGMRLTGVQVAAQLGLKPRRAQELLRELRTEMGSQPYATPGSSPPAHPAEGGAS
jgi:hypothetical protein